MAVSNRVAASPPPASATGGPPTGAAGGSLAGSYPNPTVAASAITTTEIADATIVSGDLNAAAGITSGQLAGSIAPSKITGTAVTAADTGTVTSVMILDGTIAGGDLNATIAIPSGSTATTQTAGDNSLKHATTAYVDQLPGFPAFPSITPTGTWLALSGDPAFQTGSSLMVTGVQTFTRLWIPKTITPTRVIVHIGAAGASLTTLGSATVSGTQSAPASGSWSLTTSTVGTSGSIYPAAGVVAYSTTDVLAYSAWSATTMTVQAGGYTPSASYTTGTALNSVMNGVTLYTSAGAFIASTVDQPNTAWTSASVKAGTLFPASPSITGGTYIWVGIQSIGTTPVSPRVFNVNAQGCNMLPAGATTGTNSRVGTQGTLVTGTPNSMTPGNLVNTSCIGSLCVGLS